MADFEISRQEAQRLVALGHTAFQNFQGQEFVLLEGFCLLIRDDAPLLEDAADAQAANSDLVN